MALKFFNIVSREIRVAESEPAIAAFFNSSDRGVNSQNGQDYGWRLAAEVVVELKRIKRNPETIERIAVAFRKNAEDIGDTDILKWISDHTPTDEAPVALEGDFEDEYVNEIRRLERLNQIEQETPVAIDDEDEDETEEAPAPKAPAIKKPAAGKSEKSAPDADESANL